MVKAHSLLYAIYICLIVSIVCGALLYFANLYGQLNLYYNLQEELYINNQSVVNFALGNQILPNEIPPDEKTGIEASYEAKSYGVLTLLLTKSSIRTDTVASAHFVGSFATDKTAIYLANHSRGLSYSGTVTLSGDNQLPSTFIETSYINNNTNKLTAQGKNTVSEALLPEINPKFRKIFGGLQAQQTDLSDVEKLNDSLYYNSFFNETKEIVVNPILANVIFKGNFILRSKDSIRVRKNAILEDVILIAPKITFEEDFQGTVQAFATKGIELEQKVSLDYPSVLCVYNESKDKEAKIKIKKTSKITGAVILFGSVFETLDNNTIEIEEEGLIRGDIYCTGKLFLKSRVYGSVYTNGFFYRTQSGSYGNLIADIEINADKRPAYFIAVPLFDTKKTAYGILKKVL